MEVQEQLGGGDAQGLGVGGDGLLLGRRDPHTEHLGLRPACKPVRAAIPEPSNGPRGQEPSLFLHGWGVPRLWIQMYLSHKAGSSDLEGLVTPRGVAQAEAQDRDSLAFQVADHDEYAATSSRDRAVAIAATRRPYEPRGARDTGRESNETWWHLERDSFGAVGVPGAPGKSETDAASRPQAEDQRPLARTVAREGLGERGGPVPRPKAWPRRG